MKKAVVNMLKKVGEKSAIGTVKTQSPKNVLFQPKIPSALKNK